MKTMKNIFIILIVISVGAVSCKSRKKQAEEKNTTSTTIVEEKAPNIREEAPQSVTEEENQSNPNLLISLSKSACFGECPAFMVKFYANGTVVYEGIKSVENIGMFKGKIDPDEITKVLQLSNNAGFFLLKNSYDNENVTDLPAATTYMNYKGKKKQVLCRFDCDKKALMVNKLIEELLLKVKLKQVD